MYRHVYTELNSFVQYMLGSDMNIQKQTYMFMHVYVHTSSKNVCITYMSAMYNFTDL